MSQQQIKKPSFLCDIDTTLFMIKILFLTPYPHQEAPSQRFRFEQYYTLLKEKEYTINTKPFFNNGAWSKLYSGSLLILVLLTLFGFAKRFTHLFLGIRADYILIHREASPIGPPIFEWVLAKVFRKKIIYDFDDAIWLEDPDEKGTIKSNLKWKSKVSKICKWSYKISVGNAYLAEFARKYNDNVVINPTTIDTENLHNPLLIGREVPALSADMPGQVRQGGTKIVIGWTGTHSTLQYLEPLLSVLSEVEKKYDFEFLVIANKNPEFNLKSFRFQPWNKQSEIVDLMQIDIGVMPLSDDIWSKGKCGFKLLQYMALEKPAIASPVGVNDDIISHEINGYLCDSNEEWFRALQLLIINEEQRRKLGKSGRKNVVENYSRLSNQANFLSLFE